MSFKLSKDKKTGVFTVDASEAGAYDWVVVTLKNTDVLRFHSLPSSLIHEGSADPRTRAYLQNSSHEKPELWVDWRRGNPPYSVGDLVYNVPGIHRVDLGIGLDTALVIGGQLQLNVMTWHQCGHPAFFSVAKVELKSPIRDIYEATVPLDDRRLVPFFVAG